MLMPDLQSPMSALRPPPLLSAGRYRAIG